MADKDEYNSYVRDMEQGSQWLRNAIHRDLFDKHFDSARLPPRKLIWRTQVQRLFASPASALTAELQHRLRLIEEKDRQADALRIKPRDPCPRCGVRSDVGCKHKRRAA